MTPQPWSDRLAEIRQQYESMGKSAREMKGTFSAMSAAGRQQRKLLEDGQVLLRTLRRWAAATAWLAFAAAARGSFLGA